MKRLLGFAVLMLALGVVRQAGATETCTPAQLQHVDMRDDHGMMCLELARALVPLVQLTAPCDAVVGIIADPRTQRYFVTCRVLYAAREWFPNYASVGGALFQPQP